MKYYLCFLLTLTVFLATGLIFLELLIQRNRFLLDAQIADSEAHYKMVLGLELLLRHGAIPHQSEPTPTPTPKL